MDTECSVKKGMSTKTKVITWVSTILLIAIGLFIYVKFFFVYREGVNEGDLNYFQKEGFVFKTYEGKMIQSGYKSKSQNAAIQSNEFKFSVENERIAQQILLEPGQQMKLHWKGYLGTLPWRGNSKFVVDSVLSVNGAAAKKEVLPQKLNTQEKDYVD